MAGPLIWSSESLEDIDAIAQFIARDSRHHAQRVVEALLALGDAIAPQPLAGRAVPKLGPSAVRERFRYSYTVLYEASSARVTDLAVLPRRRLPDACGAPLP